MYHLVGRPSTGKTTVARAICHAAFRKLDSLVKNLFRTSEPVPIEAEGSTPSGVEGL
jgi:shikimate kinase